MTDELPLAQHDALVTENSNEQVEQIENEVAPQEISESTEAQPENQKSNTDGVKGDKKPGGWERKLRRLERENAELKAKIAPPSFPAAFSDKSPQLADFNTIEEYTEAVTDWRFEKKLQEQKAQEQKAKAEEEQRKIAEEWQNKIDNLPDQYWDFEYKVANVRVPIGDNLSKAILESNVGPQIAYFLAENQGKISELNSLGVRALVREIESIENQIIGKFQPNKPSVRSIKQAPAPMKSVSTASTIPNKPDLRTLKGMDYYNARMAELRSGN